MNAHFRGIVRYLLTAAIGASIVCVVAVAIPRLSLALAWRPLLVVFALANGGLVVAHGTKAWIRMRRAAALTTPVLTATQSMTLEQTRDRVVIEMAATEPHSATGPRLPIRSHAVPSDVPPDVPQVPQKRASKMRAAVP